MINYSTRTYQTRIPDGCDELLSSYASLVAHVEHSLFASIAAGKTAGDLKSSYLTSFGITARQFNAIRVNVEGKIDAIKEQVSNRIKTKKDQIESLEKAIPRLKNRKKLHQKKRRINLLKNQLQKLETIKANKKNPLCFGSRRLFQAQFNLEANGYKSHEQWKNNWRK